jgi:ArsR family transcriptional regulator
MSVASLPLTDAFSALADSNRCRMLWLLDRQELTVGELCAVLQLPQSTVSRHLKTLADAAWVSSRRDGTSRYYAIALDGHDGAFSRLWQLTREQLAGRPAVTQDERRLAGVLAARSETSQRFFASAADRWDRMRDELFGADFSVRAMAGLLPADCVVGDLGCGTGLTGSVLAPWVGRVIGVDASDEMLASAAARLKGVANIELRKGALEALPIDDNALDAATMMLVLHHLPSPATAVAEAARVLRPGGRLLIVDMAPHDREEYRSQMGHVWLGFSDEQIGRMLRQAGFGAARIHALSPASDTKGPTLFAAAATKP